MFPERADKHTKVKNS